MEKIADSRKEQRALRTTTTCAQTTSSFLLMRLLEKPTPRDVEDRRSRVKKPKSKQKYATKTINAFLDRKLFSAIHCASSLKALNSKIANSTKKMPSESVMQF